MRADPGPSARVKAFLGVVLLLLVIPGLADVEAWPMTAWRLFSLSRGERQTEWVIDAVAADGSARTVSFEELPLRYRHAAWPMAELPGASSKEREGVCQALLAATLDVVPDLVELRIVRDRQRMVERDGDWVVTHAPEVIHACASESDG